MMETAGRAVNGDSDIDIYTVLFCVLLSTLSLSLSFSVYVIFPLLGILQKI